MQWQGVIVRWRPHFKRAVLAPTMKQSGRRRQPARQRVRDNDHLFFPGPTSTLRQVHLQIHSRGLWDCLHLWQVLDLAACCLWEVPSSGSPTQRDGSNKKKFFPPFLAVMACVVLAKQLKQSPFKARSAFLCASMPNS